VRKLWISSKFLQHFRNISEILQKPANSAEIFCKKSRFCSGNWHVAKNPQGSIPSVAWGLQGWACDTKHSDRTEGDHQNTHDRGTVHGSEYACFYITEHDVTAECPAVGPSDTVRVAWDQFVYFFRSFFVFLFFIINWIYWIKKSNTIMSSGVRSMQLVRIQVDIYL
jgi:hypothetical protein